MKTAKKALVVILAAVMLVCSLSACDLFKPTPQELILGAWRDSTGTTGYEFKENGICVITFANFVIPIINVKYDGSIDGVYTVTEDEEKNMFVTITYTILSQSVTKNYKFTVENSALNLIDQNDGTSTMFIAYTEAPSDTSASAAQ